VDPLRESAQRGNTWMELPLDGATHLERRLRTEYRNRYGHDPLEDSQELLDAPFNRLSVMWTIAGWL